MSKVRHDRVLALLSRHGDWVTAGELADAIGVTPRSIRTYVTALNARVDGGGVVESGPQGYRVGASAALVQRGDHADTPRDRLHRVIRTILASPDGADVFTLAEELFVSPATIDADLARVRGLLGGTALTLERTASRARLVGDEAAQRRLLSTLAYDETADGRFDITRLRRSLGEGSVSAGALAPFADDLVAGLRADGYFVNEFGIGDVMINIAVAADRVAEGRALTSSGGSASVLTPIADLVSRLARTHLGIDLGAGDRDHLAALVQSRIVAPGSTGPSAALRDRLQPEVEQAVRMVVSQAASTYLVDIEDETFIVRLALHVQNLRERVREQAWSRNPLTRELKTTYPMIFDVAVAIADGLQGLLGVPVSDDEIAYIAMHVGGRLEQVKSPTALTATIVSPGYYELHDLLRASIDRSLGHSIEVVGVETRIDPDWDALGTDLVLTTIDPPHPSDRIVRIQPFLTEADIERVQSAASRARRSRRLARLRADLAHYFVADAFVVGIRGTEDDVIRELGGHLVRAGVVDEDYVAGALERERMSSTAFTDSLAVPHAIAMTATRTAIALGMAESPMPWGEGRVQVVALVAFAAHDREAFQTVFEQLVEVFSERESVQRLLRRGTTFTAFLDELASVVDG